MSARPICPKCGIPANPDEFSCHVEGGVLHMAILCRGCRNTYSATSRLDWESKDDEVDGSTYITYAGEEVRR